MKIEGPALVVTVYVGESDHWEGELLYSAIVQRARALGLAGATVTRGMMGFGANSRIHTTSILRLSEDLPVVIEIIDQGDRLEPFLKELDEMVTEGLVVTRSVEVRHYRAGKQEPGG